MDEVIEDEVLSDYSETEYQQASYDSDIADVTNDEEEEADEEFEDAEEAQYTPEDEQDEDPDECIEVSDDEECMAGFTSVFKKVRKIYLTNVIEELVPHDFHIINFSIQRLHNKPFK